MRRRNSVLLYALASLFIIFGLAVGWEFGLELGGWVPLDFAHQNESTASYWVHVGVNTAFAALALAIMSLLIRRLLGELADKEAILQKAEDERRNFSADTAHELRTPLAVLRAHLDTLGDSETTRQLSLDVDHVTRILEQMLVKSRVEAIAVKPGEQADLSQVAAEMAAYLAPLVIKEGRSIEVLGADQPLMINGNRFALDQALRNLVENAIKYSARDSTITIDVMGAMNGNGPCMRVIDHGRGVPPEDRELIFERFHRADQRGSGSGLGLFIVRRVAESHGGHVMVGDAPGGGAMFTVQFPRSR